MFFFCRENRPDKFLVHQRAAVHPRATLAEASPVCVLTKYLFPITTFVWSYSNGFSCGLKGCPFPAVSPFLREKRFSTENDIKKLSGKGSL